MKKFTQVVLLVCASLLTACGGGSGTNGTNGINGTNGANGANGINGQSTLVAMPPEAPGKNCANGGTRIDAGLDSNGNGLLDTTEINHTQYVCNGAVGSTGAAA